MEDSFIDNGQQFHVMQLNIVLANKLRVDFAIFNNDKLIVFRAPIASITPPKIIAHITSHIVSNMPLIPPSTTIRRVSQLIKEYL